LSAFIRRLSKFFYIPAYWFQFNKFNLLNLQAQKKQFSGPVLGVKVADENKRSFTAEQLAESNRIIGLQYGSNRGASQAGMTAFGHTRQILPDGD